MKMEAAFAWLFVDRYANRRICASRFTARPRRDSRMTSSTRHQIRPMPSVPRPSSNTSAAALPLAKSGHDREADGDAGEQHGRPGEGVQVEAADVAGGLSHRGQQAEELHDADDARDDVEHGRLRHRIERRFRHLNTRNSVNADSTKLTIPNTSEATAVPRARSRARCGHNARARPGR